jgi:hypothetical protein
MPHKKACKDSWEDVKAFKGAWDQIVSYIPSFVVVPSFMAFQIVDHPSRPSIGYRTPTGSTTKSEVRYIWGNSNWRGPICTLFLLIPSSRRVFFRAGCKCKDSSLSDVGMKDGIASSLNPPRNTGGQHLPI